MADLRDREDKDQIVEAFGLADPVVIHPKHPTRHLMSAFIPVPQG